MNCPSCGIKLPMIRRPKSLRQALWGGWTCPGCGSELDRKGRVIDAGSPGKPVDAGAPPPPPVPRVAQVPVQIAAAHVFIPGPADESMGRRVVESACPAWLSQTSSVQVITHSVPGEWFQDPLACASSMLASTYGIQISSENSLVQQGAVGGKPFYAVYLKRSATAPPVVAATPAASTAAVASTPPPVPKAKPGKTKMPPALLLLSIFLPPVALLLVGDVFLAIGMTLLLISTFGAALIVVAPITVWRVRTVLREAESMQDTSHQKPGTPPGWTLTDKPRTVHDNHRLPTAR